MSTPRAKTLEELEKAFYELTKKYNDLVRSHTNAENRVASLERGGWMSTPYSL